jgi:hypothetical protein
LDKIQIIEKLFYDIVTFSYLLLPLSLLLLRKSSDKSIPVLIALYGLFCFICLYYFEQIPINYRKYYYMSYTSIEYTTFAYIFYKNVLSSVFKRLILICSLLFLLFQITYVLAFKIYRLDTIPIAFETILTFTYIVYFFYEYSKNILGFYIYNHYVFWVATGILLYLGGSFFFYIMFNHLNEQQISAFGMLTYVAEILKNIFFSVAIYTLIKHPVEKKNKSEMQIPFLDIV